MDLLTVLVNERPQLTGVSPVEVAAALARTRSLIEPARTLTGNGHSLQPVDDSGVEPSSMPALQSLADPERPIPPPTFLQTFVGKRPRACLDHTRRFCLILTTRLVGELAQNST